VLYAVAGPGDPTTRAVCGALAATWSLRLGVYLALRNAQHEERRYAELRARWGSRANARMLLFFVLQAVVAWVVALTFLPLAFRPEPAAPGWLVAGAALSLIGVIGETVADAQLSRFRSDPRNRGAVMDQGLWRYSRHPNFFFESVHWAGYPLLAVGAPHGWLALVGLVLITLLLLKFSGIPTVEQASARAGRRGYDAYVRRTSAFIPWPPRGP
jgi:steroid 5-alpha reductase family enzyme